MCVKGISREKKIQAKKAKKTNHVQSLKISILSTWDQYYQIHNPDNSRFNSRYDRRMVEFHVVNGLNSMKGPLAGAYHPLKVSTTSMLYHNCGPA